MFIPEQLTSPTPIVLDRPAQRATITVVEARVIVTHIEQEK